MSDGKRYPLNMRTTRKTRERIEAAAAASGRSLVQQVEYLIERALRDEDMRAIIREEIRTALAEREATVPGSLPVSTPPDFYRY